MSDHLDRVEAFAANDIEDACYTFDGETGTTLTYGDLRALCAEVRKLRKSVGLADAYIDKSPCDPDIYAEQWQAWQAYAEDRKTYPNRPQRP